MGFNGKMKRQEALSKEDVNLLRQFIEIAVRNEAINGVSRERIQFLSEKLQRMEKAFRS